jgi:arylsulfatase A-like enzyme
MKRYAFLTAILCCFSLVTYAEDAEPPRPNILFILSDDQRWDALGAEGNRDIITPNMDALAREGVLFPRGTVAVSLCCPSRATLVTGLLPHQNGYYSNKNWTKEAGRGFTEATAVELLRRSGYSTTLIGKWHINPAPWKCGFSEVRTWMPQGADAYVNPKLAHGKSDKVKEADGHVTEIFTEDALAYLREKKSQSKDAPFFLWLAYTAPHTPQKPVPARCCEPYRDLPADHRPPGFPTGETQTGPWAQYYGAITHLDEQMGRVLKALDESGLRDNTVVFYLSDNGWMMGSHGRFGKIIPEDESTRVPFIIRAPKPYQGWSGVSDALVSSLDLPPTWLNLAGVEPPTDWPGTSLLPLTRAKQAQPAFRDDVYCEFEDEKAWPGQAFKMVETSDWKIVLRPHRSAKNLKELAKEFRDQQKDHEYLKAPVLKEIQLFDLKNDPFEERDVADDPKLTSMRHDMLLRLKDWMRRTNDPGFNEDEFPQWTLAPVKGHHEPDREY